MRQEWIDEAKEFAEAMHCEEDLGDLYVTRGKIRGQDLRARDIYILMASFAIKKIADIKTIDSLARGQ